MEGLPHEVISECFVASIRVARAISKKIREATGIKALQLTPTSHEIKRMIKRSSDLFAMSNRQDRNSDASISLYVPYLEYDYELILKQHYVTNFCIYLVSSESSFRLNLQMAVTPTTISGWSNGVDKLGIRPGTAWVDLLLMRKIIKRRIHQLSSPINANHQILQHFHETLKCFSGPFEFIQQYLYLYTNLKVFKYDTEYILPRHGCGIKISEIESLTQQVKKVIPEMVGWIEEIEDL